MMQEERTSTSEHGIHVAGEPSNRGVYRDVCTVWSRSIWRRVLTQLSAREGLEKSIKEGGNHRPCES